MFPTRWQLFRLLGIPIRVDPSWLIILALLTWTLFQQFHGMMSELAAGMVWLLALGTALGFFACIVLHELGHAVTARAQGMSINGITLFLFGGVAEMEDEPPSARAEFFMAIAGPVVSAVLAAGFAGLDWLGGHWGWPNWLQVILFNLAAINCGVLIFNLVPAFPLDGGRVLRSILWAVMRNLRRATHAAAQMGQAFAWFLIILGVLLFFSDNVIGGLWLGLIGLFLNNAARGSYQQVLLKQVLTGEPVARFMNRQPIVVPPWVSLRVWVEDYVYRHHRKTFPVGTEEHLEGVISTQDLAAYPRDSWEQHTVAETMRRDIETMSITPQTDALHALGQMQTTGASRLLVVQEGRLVGIVSLKDLLRFLDLKLQLEGPDGSVQRPNVSSKQHSLVRK
jgi:Zn-dependent protease/predicted transcriptional regulator